MRRMIIDTDTASDDAVAIIMALRHPDVVVDAITVVAGNMTLEQGSINARYTVELCGEEVPVYEGAAAPLVKEAFTAEWFHGSDGMGEMHYPVPQVEAAGTDAVAELIRRFGEAPGEIELVTLGPLTNIALALRQEPQLAEWIKSCVVMGGAACTVGNVTPAAEYNIWCDPEAALEVFASGMKLAMVGWEHSRDESCLNSVERDAIVQIGTDLARFAIDCNLHVLDSSIKIQGDPGLGLPDPVAMAVALEPAVSVRRSTRYVTVVLDGPARGMTVVDELGVAQNPPYKDEHYTDRAPNVEVIWEIDPAAWKLCLVGLLSD